MIEIIDEGKTIQGVFWVSASVVASGLVQMATIPVTAAAGVIVMPITFIAIGAVGVAVSVVWAVVKGIRWMYVKTDKVDERAPLIQ